MNDFNYYTPTRYVFGRGVESQTGELTKWMGVDRVLLVYGGGSVVRSGLLDRVKASLDAVAISYVELGGVQPNPTDDRVYEGIDICRSENLTGIFARAS